MQEFSKKRLLKTKNKGFFDISVYQFLGMLGVLESDIKKLDFMIIGVRSREDQACCLSCKTTARTAIFMMRATRRSCLIYLYDWEKFSRIFMNTGK